MEVCHVQDHRPVCVKGRIFKIKSDTQNLKKKKKLDAIENVQENDRNQFIEITDQFFKNLISVELNFYYLMLISAKI